MLGAIGGALSLAGSIGGLFGGSKKAPRIPEEALWGMRQSKELADRQMKMQDLLSKDFLAAIPEIRTGYDEYREGLQGIIDQFSEEGSPLKNWRERQLGKIDRYDQAESNLIEGVAKAGSEEQIAAKRNMARQDAMAAIGQLVDTTRSRQMARGMGGGSGGVLGPEYADRVAHRAGRQVYDAGEAERRFGLALQTQLYPMIASGAQRSIDNYMMPQNLMTHKAGSHARQAQAVDVASMPSHRATQSALMALDNLGRSVGGVHQAQLEQFSMDQESTGSFFDALGGLGKGLGSGKYGDLFGKLGNIFGGGGGSRLDTMADWIP